MGCETSVTSGLRHFNVLVILPPWGPCQTGKIGSKIGSKMIIFDDFQGVFNEMPLYRIRKAKKHVKNVIEVVIFGCTGCVKMMTFLMTFSTW